MIMENASLGRADRRIGNQTGHAWKEVTMERHFRVQKISLFGLLHSYCLIMHTCVLMFAFPL
jgi:hypothetical protein